VDQGQGFGSLIQSVRSKWRDAEIARLGHDWTQAVSACDAIMEVGRRIDALDVKRKKTMAARTAVEAARQNALTAHADTLVTNLWQTVAREANRADTLFEEGQFDAANEIWAALGSQWNELRDKAQDICAFNAATNAYESAWARVRTPDDYKAENTIGPEPSDARRSYLAQLSGPVWQELTEQERIAKNSCTNFEARRLAYERAVPLLDKASSLAAVNFKNRERCERTNQAHATEQQIPIVSNHFAADMAVRPPRLLIATRADGHELSGAGVWLSGISDSWRTPAQIDLKHGVHYEFSLSNSQQNAIEFLPAKLVIDANWNGDSNVCVNLMTRKPELPSPDREDDHLYFSRGSLTSQSQLDPSLFVKSHKRFINTGPNLLSDTLLAKTWVLYNPNEIMTFNNARSYASTQNGRLPTLRELSSLLVLRQNETDWARLNGAFFPKHMRSPRFWAEETGFLNLSLLCRFVDFGDGTTGKISPDDQCAVLVIRD